MQQPKFPVILSFDVGVIHLSYCLMTKKVYNNKVDWHIIDWNNIDLTNRDDMKCHCGAKASLSNIINDEIKYYCKTHAKKVDTTIKPFEECYQPDKSSVCNQIVKEKECGKKASFKKGDTCYCTTHAKQVYKSETNTNKMKPFKFKNSKLLNFDDVKYSLMMVLESKPHLLAADYVVIENQPSFKNPRMKSIASTLYDYYLIRGIIDKERTKSNITAVKFMSPSNKLKLASDGDTKQLVKAKATDDTKAYKLTKSLGIKYCIEMVGHLPEWLKHFNSHKKKDDLADSFLQGAYFFTNTKECTVVEENYNTSNKLTEKPAYKPEEISVSKSVEKPLKKPRNNKKQANGCPVEMEI